MLKMSTQISDVKEQRNSVSLAAFRAQLLLKTLVKTLLTDVVAGDDQLPWSITALCLPITAKR